MRFKLRKIFIFILDRFLQSLNILFRLNLDFFQFLTHLLFNEGVSLYVFLVSSIEFFYFSLKLSHDVLITGQNLLVIVASLFVKKLLFLQLRLN